MNVGERIKTVRKFKKLTQEEVANRAGISQNHLSEIELGKRNAHMQKLQNICNAMNITVAELMNDFQSNKISEMKQIPIILDPRSKNLFEDKNIIETIPTNINYINKNFKYFYYKVPDNSMNLVFQKNSIILVQIKSIGVNGDIVLISVNNECLIRQIFVQNDTITLISKSKDGIIPVMLNINAENVQIIGKIIISIQFH